MKKKGLVLVAVAVLTVNAYAQTAFDYLKESLVNVLTVSSLMHIADYEYNGENALWGAYLEPGKTIDLSAQYDAGVEYLMFAAAHTERIDINLKVYQGQGTGGTVIAKDTTPDAAPIVRFVPTTSGWHCFELINASRTPAFVSLVVLKSKRNARFSLDTLLEALQNTLAVSGYLAEMLPPASVVPANKWTLFGGNIRQGSAASYYNTQLVRGNYILVGAGENSVNNCDVEIIEQYASGSPDGRKISQNTDSRFPFDFALCSANPSNYYYLKVANQSSRNASSFMFGFLILVK